MWFSQNICSFNFFCDVIISFFKCSAQSHLPHHAPIRYLIYISGWPNALEEAQWGDRKQLSPDAWKQWDTRARGGLLRVLEAPLGPQPSGLSSTKYKERSHSPQHWRSRCIHKFIVPGDSLNQSRMAGSFSAWLSDLPARDYQASK